MRVQRQPGTLQKGQYWSTEQIQKNKYVATLSEVQFCLGEWLHEVSEALVEALVKGVENTEECCG